MWNFVDTLSAMVTKAGLADRIFNDRQLEDVLGGSDARRYGLVNRALKEGALHRLKRGSYVLDRRYRSELIHPFVVAQALRPGSYVSFETALSHHGWIPEGVFTTASVWPGRKTISYDVPNFGLFGFHPLALQDYQFLVDVRRVAMGSRPALVANPLRALMDLVALRKERWSGLGWILDGMRIDETQLRTLRARDFAALEFVYKHKAVIAFLDHFRSAVLSLKAELH